jgi:hypothetical protein
MYRAIATVLAVAALVAIVLAPTAGAAPKTCFASSSKVAGKNVTGLLTSSNVNDVQARFATCTHAKKVMTKALSLGLEEPRSVKGFYCRPTVLSTKPEAVKYVCTFKGADTPMFVKLTFSVVFES